MFHLRVSVTTAWQAMRRLGFTAQLPIHPKGRPARTFDGSAGYDRFPQLAATVALRRFRRAGLP
jgi:hypothetical protein